MTRNILGFSLIDAPHSALNNAGQDAGAHTDNAIVVKMIRKGKSIYPYVSGQAWRYWWRMLLAEKYHWDLSPLTRDSKIAFTNANPFLYPDDDVFGYMRAIKDTSKKKNKKSATQDTPSNEVDKAGSSTDSSTGSSGTLTRLSPLKCSPLVSVYEQTPTSDFGVMARQEGNPVPFEHQFYATVMKGIFSLDITSVGVFGTANKTGYKNLDDGYMETTEMKSAVAKTNAKKIGDNWVLPKQERTKRIQDAIGGLSYIYSTTKSTLHLTDVTPKFLILAVIEGGNHLFMNITNDDPKRIINITALEQTINDYQDTILSDIYIGRNEGFLDTAKTDLENLQQKMSGQKTIHLLSVKKAIEEFAKITEKYIPEITQD